MVVYNQKRKHRLINDVVEIAIVNYLKSLPLGLRQILYFVYISDRRPVPKIPEHE